MKHSALRYLTGAGVAGLIGLGGVGLAHAQSDDTGTTDTVVDDPTVATDGTAVDDGATTDATVDDGTAPTDDGTARRDGTPTGERRAGCEGGGRGGAGPAAPDATSSTDATVDGSSL